MRAHLIAGAATGNTEDFLSAAFGAFQAGDRIRFLTRDRGLGLYWRTGTVTRVTTATIAVDCDPNTLGSHAIIRRNHAYDRKLKRAATYRIEIRRDVPRRPSGTERCDRIRVICDPSNTTVHQKVLPPNSGGIADAIQHMGWDLLGALTPAADVDLVGDVRRMPATT
ncbi:hypothetical protein [Kitasatospora sp. NPDC001132]